MGGAAGGISGEYKTISQITTENLGMGDKPDYFVVRGTVTFIRHEEGKQPFYQACANESQVRRRRMCDRLSFASVDL